MRFRASFVSAIVITVTSLVAGCSGSSEETHGVGDSGDGGGKGGGAGTIPGSGGTGGTGGVIPTQGGNSAGGAGPSGTGGNSMCAMSTASAMPAAPVLMLLVDLSLSMNDPAPNSMESKWIETRDALVTALGSLPDGMNVGLTFYPDVPTSTMPCFDGQVDVPIAALDAAQRTALGNALQGEMPSGSTPTHDAYVYALEQLRANTLRGAKYVVLITDGIPTYGLGCTGTGMNNQMPPIDTAPLVTESATAMAGGIRTFVIGSPGSEGARMSLSAMASQGGTARAGCSDAGPTYCHFDMTTEPDFSTALNAALGEVIADIPLTCEFAIPPPPSGMELDRSKVNVTYDDGDGVTTDLGRDTSGACSADGWDYTPDGSQIRLCGALCEQVKMDGNASITIVLGCATRPVVL
jgi:hypothetical protein